MTDRRRAHLAAVPGRRAAGPEPLWREAAGRALREVRHGSGRTLADVAGQAGVSTQYLSEVERGAKEPSSEVLGAVCRALDLRLLDLTVRVSRSLAAPPARTGRGATLCLAA